MKNGSMLLGVVATSMPIKHITDAVPHYQVCYRLFRYL